MRNNQSQINWGLGSGFCYDAKQKSGVVRTFFYNKFRKNLFEITILANFI